MARELTERQQKFLDVLMEEAGGNITAAKKLAGYSPTTANREITNSLKEEILEVTHSYLAFNVPKAAMAMVSALKTEKMQVEAKGGVMLMPPKQVQEDDD